MSNIDLKDISVGASGVRRGPPKRKPEVRDVVVAAFPSDYLYFLLCGGNKIIIRKKFNVDYTGHIIAYASTPIQRVEGLIKVARVEHADIGDMERMLKGNCYFLNKNTLREYMGDRESGYVIHIESTKKHKPIPRAELQRDVNFTAPQGFYYPTKNLVNYIYKRWEEDG